ncbi:2-hydroxyacid dehydrogenase [Rhizobium sp. NZLR1]|uniref:2-hydroxyacid dehydrogenase n=1 Tax=Rhizobium sp. NZLR1 TaxID=2731096 RepID=UPI001A9842DA|nr:2-hydroxyacid dehydrogenase [Rhizobium sp. NZLR1]MBX5204062.1 dehydrogenase [Rhizobium sp. NZLR1]QSZ25141.1 2-hydroxyacid dehydrogenase [Rhizobium sp. NZLR1]
MARIFICGDTGQTDLLERVSQVLTAKGHCIVRGPPDDCGAIKRYSRQEQDALFKEADVAVLTTRHECSRTLMSAAPRLRGICFPVTGVETLDVRAATDLGIIVGHGAVQENTVGMAEATVMLMLMSLYDVQRSLGLMARGEWRGAVPFARQIARKTVGMIGFGRIAREVASRLKPFGARIITCSPRTSESDLPQFVQKVELADLMRESDVVAVLTGLTDETRGMIGAQQLSLMKEDAFLINTARGAIVDEPALIEALRERRIAGAALDAFATEPLPLDSPLRRLDNVLLTPHSIGHTKEGVSALCPALVENVTRILQGELPLICKNPEAEPLWRARLVTLNGKSD